MLGEGKLQEIAAIAKEEGSRYLVFDFELKSSQIRNIQKITDLEVIDRVQVILEIFAHHARTRDAKIQIEISRLQYMLPRLQSLVDSLHQTARRHVSKRRRRAAARARQTYYSQKD